jgi:hypothetical protein
MPIQLVVVAAVQVQPADAVTWTLAVEAVATALAEVALRL